jgi:hypothetical protein
MNQIKKFVDKVANTEARQGRDVLLPINDAKELRDEITKLLADKQSQSAEPVIEVVMKGSSW